MSPAVFLLMCLLELASFSKACITTTCSSLRPNQKLFIAVFDDSTNLEQHIELFERMTLQEGIKSSTRFTFGEFFKGISFELSSVQDIIKIGQIKTIKEIFPITELASPALMTPLPSLAPRNNTMGMGEIGKLSGYNGKGLKVGIIDTGIDYTHPYLGGCFGPGCKVAYGYNLVHEVEGSSPHDPMDSCSGHGTHVAGIIAANGKNFTGIAPEVTLGAYKIFSCRSNNKVNEDVILAAIEKAYQDKMDIINISFGLSSGWQKQLISIAVDKLTEAGIHIFASGGNLGADGLWLMNSPAVASKVSAVASFDNVQYLANVFKVDAKDEVFDYFTKDSLPLSFKSKELISLQRNDYACTPLVNNTWIRNKIVLVQLGNCSVFEKISNVKASGALAVGFYNSEFGPLYSVTDVASADFPTLFLTQTTGRHLYSLLEKEKVFITFLPKPRLFNNPYGGKISAFSSWGPGPLLEQKPDFGAPGGLVYSTFPLAKGGFATLSGTSMATPYVSAIAAILLEARPGITPLELRDLLRQTSIPAKSDSYLSPVQQQGAGMTNLLGALNASTLVSPSKMSLLSDDLEKNYYRQITVKNTGKQSLKYVVSHKPALSVIPWDKSTGELSKQPLTVPIYARVKLSINSFQLAPGEMRNISVKFSKSVEVKAGEKLLYGGYIVILPSHIEGEQDRVPLQVLTPVRVTYSGMFGTYKDIPILLDVGMLEGDNFSLDNGDFPTIEASFRHPVKKLRIKILNRSDKIVGFMTSGISHLGRHDYTKHVSSTYVWKGELISESGKASQARNGIYKFRLELLGPFGDENLLADWQGWTSPEFTVSRRLLKRTHLM